MQVVLKLFERILIQIMAPHLLYLWFREKTIRTGMQGDEFPVPGANYYRLRQIDRDGSSSLSEVREVSYQVDAEVQVHPTLVQHELHIISEEKLISLELFDGHGHPVLSQDLNEVLRTDVNMTQFPSGFYLLRFKTTTSNGLRRIIKN